MRTGLVPEVEMPHWKASDFSWLSLREGGILIAMHIDVGVFSFPVVDKHVKVKKGNASSFPAGCSSSLQKKGTKGSARRKLLLSNQI